MNHDRIHSREPSHHVDRWSVGVIDSIAERDGHCVVTVRPVGTGGGDGDDSLNDHDDALADSGSDPVDLVVTLAVRDLFVSRLPIEENESPIGERVWYRKRGDS